MASPTRRTVLGSIGAAATVTVTGCNAAILGQTSGSAVERRTVSPIDEDEPYVGMVYASGGLGDRSFNDMANKGVKKARVEFGIEYANEAPASGTDAESLEKTFGRLQENYATSDRPAFDLVTCIGYTQAGALKKTSKRFPDQQFMLVDSVVDRDNVSNYVFKEHQGSFLVGELAGLLTGMDVKAGAGATNTSAKTVGFVGGAEVPLIKKFEAGFAAGVRHADPEVTVLRSYTGSFGDPDAGETAANRMIDQGADLIYHAAGGTGLGVFRAAQAKSRFAIGVDADQSRSLPQYANVILASMVKRIDTAVYRSIASMVDGSLEGGTITSLGLAEDGLQVAYGVKLGHAVPTDVRNTLDDARGKIVDGEIEVPMKPTETAAPRIGGDSQ